MDFKNKTAYEISSQKHIWYHSLKETLKKKRLFLPNIKTYYITDIKTNVEKEWEYSVKRDSHVYMIFLCMFQGKL